MSRARLAREIGKATDSADGLERYMSSMGNSELEEVLRELSDAYYDGEPLVSDNEYDSMAGVLEARDPGNGFLAGTGSSGAGVLLPCLMPSLDKIKDDSWLPSDTSEVVVMDKLDGVSLLFDTGARTLYTKKGADIGTKKRHLVPHILDEKLLSRLLRMTKGILVRGEAIIKKSDAGKVKDALPDSKGLRNVVSGTLNSKDPRVDVLSLIDFVAYAMPMSKLPVVEQLETLKGIGFNVVWSSALTDTLSNTLVTRRSSSEYEIDGVVVSLGGWERPEKSNPRTIVAYKNNDVMPTMDTKVIEVEWRLSKFGYLHPRVRVEDCLLDDGSVIKYATAHCASFVRDNGVGPGAVVKIVKSGGVIPQILGVVKAVEPQFPEGCVWSDNGVHIHGDGPDATRVTVDFFSTIGAEYLGEATILKASANGYDGYLSILRAASDEDYDLLGGGSRKLLGKIYRSVNIAISKVDIATLMVATLSFGKGVGIGRAREVVRSLPNFTSLPHEEIVAAVDEIPGFSGKLSRAIADGAPKFVIAMDAIRESTTHLGDVSSRGPQATTHSNVVFSGFRDASLAKAASERGFSLSNNVTRNTDLVVFSNETTTKMAKAMELDISTMDVSTFRELVGAV